MHNSQSVFVILSLYEKGYKSHKCWYLPPSHRQVPCKAETNKIHVFRSIIVFCNTTVYPFKKKIKICQMLVYILYILYILYIHPLFLGLLGPLFNLKSINSCVQKSQCFRITIPLRKSLQLCQMLVYLYTPFAWWVGGRPLITLYKQIKHSQLFFTAKTSHTLLQITY